MAADGELGLLREVGRNMNGANRRGEMSKGDEAREEKELEEWEALQSMFSPAGSPDTQQLFKEGEREEGTQEGESGTPPGGAGTISTFEQQGLSMLFDFSAGLSALETHGDSLRRLLSLKEEDEEDLSSDSDAGDHAPDGERRAFLDAQRAHPTGVGSEQSHELDGVDAPQHRDGPHEDAAADNGDAGEEGDGYSDEEYEEEEAEGMEMLREEGEKSRALLEDLFPASSRLPSLEGADASEALTAGEDAVGGEGGEEVDGADSPAVGKEEEGAAGGEAQEAEGKNEADGSRYGIKLMMEELVAETADQAVEEAGRREGERRRQEARRKKEAEKERLNQAAVSLLAERARIRRRVGRSLSLTKPPAPRGTGVAARREGACAAD
ncbi:hypothetical protein T484DRAFT_1903989 [Baffinella frigidus]|nr:hypothetical protein T484DRAFT_1903989 [Cryptophyta sp. CCMP2293]